jgi:hypothetical protein
VIRSTPRFFMMGSQYPKARRAASQERSLECRQTSEKREGTPMEAAQHS